MYIILNKGDILQIEIACEEEIELTVSGQNGSEPYTGNNLKSILFTVKVSERDNYDIRFTSTNATGKVTVKKWQRKVQKKINDFSRTCFVIIDIELNGKKKVVKMSHDKCA